MQEQIIDPFNAPNSSRVETADRLAALRLSGRLPEAIELCRTAIARWPTDSFFSKILSDLYFQSGNHQEAFIALADFLGSNRPSTNLLSEFGKRYNRFRRVLSPSEMAKFARLLSDAIRASDLHPHLQRSVRKILLPDLVPDPGDQLGAEGQKLRGLLASDADFDAFVRVERSLEQLSPDVLTAVLDKYVLTRERNIKTFRIDLHCVSIYEKLGKIDSALRVVSELLAVRVDTVAARSLFRLCRLKKDYSAADALLEQHPSLLRYNEFNMLYEFVYYFEAKNDFHAVQGILRTIEKSFAKNLPVLRTLRNFYIRFGLIKEAKGLEEKIAALFEKERVKGSKFTAEVAESEIELASKVQELYSQLEHQKQLAAISDLTTGISHELGQPITNIRYTVQFYRRIFQNGAAADQLSVVFDSILEETQRMGGLIRRLSPLTSSRSIVTEFDVMERIRLRVDGERPRLTESGIVVTVSPKRRIQIEGDSVKFDQLVSNLLLNAIDAVCEKHPSQAGKIDFQVTGSGEQIRISVSDNGPGVPIGNRNKIFDPFFSTKAPGKGEGLGLFIIWSLLKMVGGKIWVDSNYHGGARFVLTMPKRQISIDEEAV